MCPTAIRLYKCLQFFEAGVVSALVGLMKSPDSKIRSEVEQVLRLMSYPPEVKKEIVDKREIPILLDVHPVFAHGTI